MKTIAKLALIMPLFMLKGCFSEEWTGYVYPDRGNLSNHLYIGKYDSLESCRNAALGKLSSLHATNKGDYECGLNCKGSICEKTER